MSFLDMLWVCKQSTFGSTSESLEEFCDIITGFMENNASQSWSMALFKNNNDKKKLKALGEKNKYEMGGKKLKASWVFHS